jgi:large subunit ribosomal protein L6
MSKVGKQEFVIPSGVTVEMKGEVLNVKGPLGTLTRQINTDMVEVKIAEGKATFAPKRNDKKSKSLWGTYAAHLKSMIAGVQKAFTKKLLVEGVGYKWEVKGKEIQLMLGYSHPIMMKIPDGLTIKIEKLVMDITGIDKEMVGSFAKNIRQLRQPEPYKGKGIRYSDEVILRKQGKRSA